MARDAHKADTLLRDTRGNATAEAVIMLPAFIIIWGAILYLGYAYESAIDEAAITRRDAWAHVMNDCRGGVPGGSEITDATSGAFGPIEEIFGLIDTIISLIPFIGSYWPGLIPDEKQFVHRSSVEKPTVLGGGTTATGHTIVLMCNEREVDVNLEQMSLEAWNFLGF